MISTLFCFIFLSSSFTCQALAISTSATSAILMDMDSGRILYEQNADARRLIASTTKIMTALVAVENDTLSDVVTVKRAHTLAEGSSMYLKEGERLTLETLLYGLLLNSGNDAALVIAEHVGGNVEKFVRMMNEKAKELGMSSSSFANPNGLDNEKNYSTARDMAKLAAAVMENETLVRICSTRSVTIGGRVLSNHNRLLRTVEGCIGLKTGYTRAAGRTLVSCVQRNGQRLIAVTLQDGNDWADHAALYDYGFATYPAKRFATAGQTLRRLPISGGGTSTVDLVAAEGFAWPLATGEQIQILWEMPKTLKAPLSAGEQVGQVVYSLKGKEVGRVDLLCRGATDWRLPEPKDFLWDMLENLER